MTTKHIKTEGTKTTADAQETMHIRAVTIETVNDQIQEGLDDIIAGVRAINANLLRETSVASEFRIKPWHMLVAFGLGAWASAVGAQVVLNAHEEQKVRVAA
jgi:hypothetical protein